MNDLQSKLNAWSAAGLLDTATTERILQWERTHDQPETHRWQVRLALIFGAVLLGAGILLFVAAHWENVGPLVRLLLVMGTLCGLHGAASAIRERFDTLATILHATGTVALGGAIALSGQIFNIESHWPNAILLWALGAAAGWWLLRDAPQKTLALLLGPAWLVCELGDRMEPYSGGTVCLTRIILVLGTLYLVQHLAEPMRAAGIWLFAAGALAVPVSVGVLSAGWSDEFDHAHALFAWGFLPLRFRLLWILLLLAALALVWLRNRAATPVMAGAIAVSIALPWLVLPHTVLHPEWGMTNAYTAWQPSAAFYLVLAFAAAGLAWWGVLHTARVLVNYATLAFGAVVLWFYFSNLMDKLDRSLGLIVLGVLFLAGGYALERLRRRLLLHMPEVSA